jgi:UDP-N-acetylglucosamine diphosphorylase / glucose-1-phosphate thymidylyltransferase / UDP-N-acetylgalactosamine diphosphorylase / glucosamine-1-phosphate N-acetyltransferase / galactosamine-1-phosphate N-acetyltransferase
MFRASDFFNIGNVLCSSSLADVDNIWEILPRLPEIIETLACGKRTIRGSVGRGSYLDDGLIFIEDGAIIESGAYIKAPAYIGRGATVRHGAYIRENVILMSDTVLGHASEAKNSLFLNNAKAPHLSYVGDSVLGNRVNLGAGVKLSNTKIFADPEDPKSGNTIKIKEGGIEYDTGLTRLGAILGDNVQIGCNTVLNPGTLIGPRSLIYPALSVRSGRYPSDIIIKSAGDVSRRIDAQ